MPRDVLQLVGGGPKLGDVVGLRRTLQERPRRDFTLWLKTDVWTLKETAARESRRHAGRLAPEGRQRAASAPQ
jgi:hypothetical protein